MDERDAEAFRGLYRAHYRGVCRYLAARADAEDVEDLAAETFLIAWRRADVVPDEPLPWLLNVALNVLANQRRGVRRADALSARLTAVARLHVEGVEVDAERRAQQRAVLVALTTLRADDRELVLLHVWDGLPAREIAVVLQVSAVAGRARLSRARRRLDRALRTELTADRPTALRPIAVTPPTRRRP